MSWSPANAALAIMLTLLFLMFLLLFMTLTAQPAEGQTFQVIHNFTGGQDGANPYAGVTLDRAGNLYGTAYYGGGTDDGTVYKLTHQGSGWTFSPLYSFAGGSDGINPDARVIFGPNGTLYGTTERGGNGGCAFGNTCGTVFNLRPPATVCKAVLCPWTETVLYRFTGRY
jgi:uncharacterized repeat protein (TIGR03803 family)